MIATNRRRQFGGGDDRIKIIHPTWWHVKFHRTNANDPIIFKPNSDFSFSLKEVVSAPDGATVKQSGRTIVADKIGDYDIYFTVSVWSNTTFSHQFNSIDLFRLPIPYSSNGYLRPLNGYIGGGVQNLITQVYLLSAYPPSGPSNSALGPVMAPYINVHIPSGSLDNYINSSNTNWRALYNAGRLIEVNYKIIED